MPPPQTSQHNTDRPIPEWLQSRDLHDLWQDVLELGERNTHFRTERDRLVVQQCSERSDLKLQTQELRKQLAIANASGDASAASASRLKKEKRKLEERIFREKKELEAQTAEALASKNLTDGKYLAQCEETHALQATITVLRRELQKEKTWNAILQEREHTAVATYVTDYCKTHLDNNLTMSDAKLEFISELLGKTRLQNDYAAEVSDAGRLDEAHSGIDASPSLMKDEVVTKPGSDHTHAGNDDFKVSPSELAGSQSRPQSR